jgi:hypothetical protein
MEKSWFIFQEDHHLGPFSTSEIQELLEQEKINYQAPLWKEGIDDWYPLEHYSDFSRDPVEEMIVIPTEESELFEEEFESLPDLPELPDLPVINTQETPKSNESINEALEAPKIVVSAFEELEFSDPKEDSGPIVDTVSELTELPELPELPDLPPEVEVKVVEKIPPKKNLKKIVKEVVERKEPIKKPSIKVSSVEDLTFEEVETPEVHIEKALEYEQPVVENPLVEQPSRNIVEEESVLDEELSSEVSIKEPQSIDEDSDLDWNEIEKDKVSNKFNLKLWVAASICFITIVSTFYFLSHKSVSQSSYKGLLASQVEKISEIRSNSFSKNFQVKVFVSKDNKELVLATNLPHEAKAYLTLSSVEKRVIGTGEVVVSANSTIRNGVARFSKLSLIKGEKFLPGEYYVKVSTVPVGIREKVIKFLSSKLHLSFLTPSETHRFRGKDFIFQGTKEEFSHRLKNYFEKALEKKKIPYKDQVEKYRTFSQMSLRIFRIYEEVITSIRKGKDIESFELLYAKEAGPILQSVILDTHSLFKKYELSEPSISSTYEEVLEIGKKVGEMASDMVTMTQKKKRLRKKSRERLIKLFEKRSRYLSLEASGKAKDTQRLLENLKL